jgi:hypothetical protein
MWGLMIFGQGLQWQRLKIQVCRRKNAFWDFSFKQAKT